MAEWIHQCGQLGLADDPAIGVERRPAEAPLLEALVEQEEASMRPNEHLEPVPPAVDEDEERSVERLLTEMDLADRGQTRDALAKVDVVAGHEDARRDGDHASATSS